MAIQATNTTTASTSSAASQRALISDYNDAVRDYRTQHTRAFQYCAGAIDADMSAIDRAAALFITGLKALAEAVDGTDLINGELDMDHCIASTLEGFVEALSKLDKPWPNLNSIHQATPINGSYLFASHCPIAGGIKRARACGELSPPRSSIGA